MHARPPLRGLAALCTAALLAVTAAGAAQADDIANQLDSSIDAVAEIMPLNVGGPNGTTTLYVAPVNGDGKNGCNLTGATSVTLSVASSAPVIATVSPSSVTFTSCGDLKTLTVTPVSQGSATISAAVVANSTTGTFNVAPVAFTVNVAPPANSAPTVSVTGVTGGAFYPFGSVPAASCSVTDAEDGPSVFPATLTPVSGDYAAYGVGSQTATCSYTDAGGLTATASETYSVTDSSAPVISYLLTPAAPDGDNGWYRGTVSLVWAVTELESTSSLVLVGCVDQDVTTDRAEDTYTCSATSDGGTAATQSVTFKRDGTAPVVAFAGAGGTAGSNGWYTSPVSATFTGTDALSGPASASSTVTSPAGVEGAAVVVESPAISDAAGNTTPAGAVSESFAIDLTDPTAVFSGALGSSYFGSVPPAPTCTAVDGVSGPAGCAVTGYSTAVGTHTLTATATDVAGRTGTATQTYTVLPWTAKGFYQPVDMAGVLNSVKGGSTVPVKFELFAGSTELTDVGLVALSAKKISCVSSAPIDDVEVVSTGATSLRYDATGGQFVYNWKTPTGAGTCYALTMTADDGSSLTASFKLK